MNILDLLKWEILQQDWKGLVEEMFRLSVGMFVDFKCEFVRWNYAV